MRRALTILLALLVAASDAFPGSVLPKSADQPTVFSVYVSPQGSDENNGRSLATAVRTLDGAQKVLEAHKPKIDVEVRIAQGTYTAAGTIWRFYVPGHEVSFMPVDYQRGESLSEIGGRPVFVSDGRSGYWFSARLPAGHPGGTTNLNFYYLQVEGYSRGGLQFYGGVETNSAGVRVPASRGVNGNIVYGMVFRRLGSKHNPVAPGFGAVNTWNSSNNVIRNNQFLYNENTGADHGMIHGVYLAHHSSRNVVVGNLFFAISGNPVNIRNDSNDNVIYNNRFDRTGTVAYYADWFCDTTCLTVDPLHPRECASHGNVFYENTLGTGYDGRKIGAWLLSVPDPAYAGGPGCGNDGQMRIKTFGNG